VLAGLAGLWHDLGKYAPDWQQFLLAVGQDASATDADSQNGGEKRTRGPDHSSAGASHSFVKLGKKDRAAQLIAFAIAGHHAGLDDWQALRTRLVKPDLLARLDAATNAAPDAVLRAESDSSLFPEWFMSLSKPTAGSSVVSVKRSFELLVRMTFSALTDADFLDTEAFAEQARPEGRAEARSGWQPLCRYEQILKEYLEGLATLPETPVLLQRRHVLAWCLSAATGARGAYSLTVPTGGGKTLSSLAFALRHASIHGQSRVIVALPFLSIVDQTADVFRKVFSPFLGGRVLVEHHSNVQPKVDTDANRLASENWDAPLIVTTQVQLLESLFANRSGDCRKLHNLANSVIVLDEVQSLPAGLLDPILDVLQELRSWYGTTLLLTTATQPSLHRRLIGGWPEPKPWLDPPPTEIVPAEELPGLFASLDRIRIEWPAGEDPVEWPALAERIAEHEQVLAIVHRRDDARGLWKEVEAKARGTIHLSALMCPAHRREVLADIRRRLEEKDACRVVSTQLVEAGVDVDFPVVFRAMAGLEALAQSAGRCNREGRLSSPGRFIVYNAPTRPPGLLRHHRDIAKLMLAVSPGLSLTAPETFRNYFDRLYGGQSTDTKGIQALRQDLKFKETAATFRMIDELTTTVFVPWGDPGRKAIERFRFAGPSRDRFRALQPFGVSVYSRAFHELEDLGLLELLHDTVWCLVAESSYHSTFGLDLEPEEFQALVI
jgi:CRISPR-associated endonuclease/helicase Cas3